MNNKLDNNTVSFNHTNNLQNYNNNDFNFNELVYRNVLPKDFKQIKQLHEDLFPVKYGDQFYINTCASIGMYDKPLYSMIIEHHNIIVGFVFAQFIDYPQSAEDKDLFHKSKHPACICYILTLGLLEKYRRFGRFTSAYNL